MKSKYWIFTLNNYTDDDELYLQELVYSNQVSYLTYGREVGETTHTDHLQGYAVLVQRKALSGARRLFPRCHLEARRGDHEQARDYCQKDGDFFEAGEQPVSEQGKRSDLECLKNALNSKMPLHQVSQDFFGQYLRYEKSIKNFIALNQEKRSWSVDVRVYWGLSRTGKTKQAMEEANTEDLWVYPGKGWFDGYYGQDDVLFDDFYGDMPISTMLKVLDDWYPCSVPTKGGHVNWKPRRIWITSNTDPRDWYTNVPQDVREALMNRLKRIIHFDRF